MSGAGRQRTAGGLPMSNGLSRQHPMAISLPRGAERERRESLVLWRRPLATLHLAGLELALKTGALVRRVWRSRMMAAAVLVAAALAVLAYRTEGGHQASLRQAEKNLLWCLYWVGLGVLSSVGLGTGLHTFLLYLGPHIATVTLAAYECQSVDFPEPPYPDHIVCPDSNGTASSIQHDPMSVWTVMSKVRVEAFMWGAGTALGELPPYFMARAARLSGVDPDDDDMEEFEELQRRAADTSQLSLVDRVKLAVERLVQRVGFLGILACASIPNPLFDLAGITCGHFLVPFWTFFGATLIGKAVVKMHIQKIFVIITFNEALVETVLNVIGSLPFGQYIQGPFKELLNKQKEKLHLSASEELPSSSESVLSGIFEKFVIVMVAYFVISIINSLAQSYHKRIYSGKVKKLARD